MKKATAMLMASAIAFEAFSSTGLIFAADTDICINEVCTQNKSGLSDAYGTHSDWIELYNSGSTTADLSGWGLSDKASKPLKWVFPENTRLAPNSYLVIFASGMESVGDEIHTSFSLSKNGETLTLSTPDGTPVQTVVVDALAEDQTFGRISDSSDIFEKMNPTPGKKNERVIAKPVFSEASGFFNSRFDLTLTAQPDTEIYYTTDGSNPITSPTAKRYDQAISIYDRSNEPNIYSNYEGHQSDNDVHNRSKQRGDLITRSVYRKPNYAVDKSTVVIAVAKSADGVYSAPVAETYFVTDSKLSKYKDQTVVSIVTDPDNLFHPDYGIYVTGSQYVNWVNNGGNLSKSEWDPDNTCNFFSRGKEWERGATITIFENGENVVEQNMGIRVKGSSTRNSAQKSFNLYARTDYDKSKIEYPLLPDNYRYDGKLIDKYDSITLRSVSDANRLRDGFSQGLLADREHLTTQNMKPCTLFLNGEYWGTYMMIEKISEYFIQSNYDIPSETVELLNASGTEGDTPQKTFDEFKNFCDTYAQMDLTAPINYKAVADYIDLDSLIDHYAAGIYLGTFDWPNWNYGVWRNAGDTIADNPYSDGKWRFLTFDMDYTAGVTYDSSAFRDNEGYWYDNFRHMDKDKNEFPTNLFVALLRNDIFREKFVAVYCDYANEVCSAEKGTARADAYAQIYTNLIAESIIRWWGFYGGNVENEKVTFQNNVINGMRTFFQKRAAYTLEDMQQYLGLRGALKTITLKTNGNGKIQINSITPDCSRGSWTGQYFTELPVTITAIPDEHAVFTGWSGDLSGSKETLTLTLQDALTLEANFADGGTRPGDVNEDGVFDQKDAVALQKWLVQDSSADVKNLDAANVNGDQIINVYDLVQMKKMLKPENLLLAVNRWNSGDCDGGNGTYQFPSSTEQSVTVNTIGTTDWSVQSIYNTLVLEKGKQYRLSFTASCAEGTGVLDAVVSKRGGDWDRYIDEQITVTTTPQNFSFTTDVLSETEDIAGIVFQFGHVKNTYHIRNISLVCLN